MSSILNINNPPIPYRCSVAFTTITTALLITGIWHYCPFSNSASWSNPDSSQYYWVSHTTPFLLLVLVFRGHTKLLLFFKVIFSVEPNPWIGQYWWCRSSHTGDRIRICRNCITRPRFQVLIKTSYFATCWLRLFRPAFCFKATEKRQTLISVSQSSVWCSANRKNPIP